MGTHLLFSISKVFCFLGGEVFIEHRDGRYPAEELLQGVVLVGGMDVVGSQAKAHQDALEAEYLLESGHYRYAATAAGRDGTAALDFLHGTLGRLVGFEFEGGHIGSAAMRRGDFDPDAVGGCTFKIILE